MTDDPRVEQLLDELLDPNATACAALDGRSGGCGFAARCPHPAEVPFLTLARQPNRRRRRSCADSGRRSLMDQFDRAGRAKQVPGQLVAQGPAYLDQQEYLLVSARVKGGSSGGPVVGKYGRVVGVVAQLSADDTGADSLGYGVAVHSETICSVLQGLSVSGGAPTLPFTMHGKGFTTSGAPSTE